MEDKTLKSRICYGKRGVTGTTKIGREIKISPKSMASVNDSGFALEFYEPTVSMVIGIGNDEIMHLVMSKDAFKSLKKERLSMPLWASGKGIVAAEDHTKEYVDAQMKEFVDGGGELEEVTIRNQKDYDKDFKSTYKKAK